MLRGNSLLSSAPRMSLSALNTLEDQDRQVRIWLLGSTTVKGTVFYRIAGRFNSSGQTWQVNRRYSEFLVLRDTLVKYFSRTTDTCPGCLNYLHAIKQFDFPKKHLFVSRSQIVVNYRIQALRSFMNLLASWAFSNSPKCPTCGGFAFDIVRNFCLEGAEAMGDSNMSYIRDSFVVSTFTDAGRRSSLSRRNSFVPTPSSHTPNSQRGQQQHRRSEAQYRNTMAGGVRPDQPYRQHSSRGDEHEREGGGSSRGARTQQQRQPLQRASSSTGSGRTPQQSTNGGNAQASSSITGSFLFYQDGVEPGHSVTGSQRASTANGTSANGSQRGSQRGGSQRGGAAVAEAPPSNGSRRGILKNWNDVRQDREQNNSYQSLGGDSSASLEGNDKQYKAVPRKNRNDARSDNDSYFSLGASSGHSRDDDEYTRPSSKRGQKPANGHNRENERLQQQQQYQQQQRDMRNNDRSLNDSYLSLGASSTSGDLEDEYHSHHPSVLPSPTNRDGVFLQPLPTQKYVGGASRKPRSPPPSSSSQRQSQRARSPPPSSSSQRQSQRTRSPPPPSQRKSQRHRSPPPPQYDEDDEDQPRSSRRHLQPQQLQQPQQQSRKKQPQVALDESFATDSFVDESLRFDGMGPIAVDDPSDSDDDEIDVTGLAIDARAPPRKSTSGQDLWQPWELAKAG